MRHRVRDRNRRRSGRRSGPYPPRRWRRLRWRSWRNAEVDAQGVGGGTGDDDLRLVLARQRSPCVVVDLLPFVQTVGDDALNHLPDMLSGMPWVRWPPSGQAHAHDGVARLGRRPSARPGWPASRSSAARWQLRRRTASWRSMAICSATSTPRSHRSSACPDSLRRTCWSTGDLGFHDRIADIVFRRDQFDVLFLTLVFGSTAFQSSGQLCQVSLQKTSASSH